MAQQFLAPIKPEIWSMRGPSLSRVQWLQDLSDLAGRHINNRVSAQTSATAVNLNGAVQSTGVGTDAAMPKRYGEFHVTARVTFRISGPGTLYVLVHRTTGAVPANGAAPNAGDEIVAGDAFAGPATVGGQNMSGALSFYDSGLAKNKSYRYYLSVQGTNGLVANVVNASQLVASEL